MSKTKNIKREKQICLVMYDSKPMTHRFAKHCIYIYVYLSNHLFLFTYLPVCTAQGGGGSFKDRKPIGEVRCCESWMAEQIH